MVVAIMGFFVAEFRMAQFALRMLKFTNAAAQQFLSDWESQFRNTK